MVNLHSIISDMVRTEVQAALAAALAPSTTRPRSNKRRAAATKAHVTLKQARAAVDYVKQSGEASRGAIMRKVGLTVSQFATIKRTDTFRSATVQRGVKRMAVYVPA